MDDWRRNRACIYSQSFEDDLTRLGIPTQEYDHEVAPKVDEALYGTSDERLDAEYPPSAGGVRLLLTMPTAHIDALRIAFEVDAAGNIIYLAVDRR